MSNINIPDFPLFKTLHLEDSHAIRELISSFPSYSDFGFTSMLCWDTEEAIQVSKLQGNLVVQFQDYLDGHRFLSIIGSNNIDAALIELINFAKKKGMTETLKLVPQSVIDKIETGTKFVINEDRDNFDYILSVRMHADLEGSKNQDRRYIIGKFKRNYGQKIEVRKLDPGKHEDQIQILRCLEKWGEIRHKTKDDMRIEKKAISRILAFSDSLPVESMGLYIDNTLCAFSIFESIHDNTAVIHFEKCNLNFDGIAHYMRHVVAQHLKIKKHEHINYEQDLGIEGLRKSKEMLHPVRMLKKYTVSLAEKH
jgi:uncharacterized protein